MRHVKDCWGWGVVWKSFYGIQVNLGEIRRTSKSGPVNQRDSKSGKTFPQTYYNTFHLKGCSSMVEYLPSIVKALILIPSTKDEGGGGKEGCLNKKYYPILLDYKS